MLRYLDNASNVTEHPNENFARELMELFTLGHRELYGADVREARAPSPADGRAPHRSAVHLRPCAARLRTKTFLGTSGSSTDRHRRRSSTTGRREVHRDKFLEFFLYNEPEPSWSRSSRIAAVKPISAAPACRNSSARTCSTRIARIARSSRVRRIRRRNEQLFGIDEVPKDGRRDEAHGARLFYPPNVKGWDGGAAWLNSQTMFARENFASDLETQAMTEIHAVDGPPPIAEGVSDQLVATMSGRRLGRFVSRLEYLDGDGDLGRAASRARTTKNACAAPRT